MKDIMEGVLEGRKNKLQAPIIEIIIDGVKHQATPVESEESEYEGGEEKSESDEMKQKSSDLAPTVKDEGKGESYESSVTGDKGKMPSIEGLMAKIASKGPELPIGRKSMTLGEKSREMSLIKK